MKIAIVGSGIAGNVAAYHLHREHEITVFEAGEHVGGHTHTHDIKVVIVSGTYIQVPDGKPEFRIGPGSYFLQPGGNYRHVTSCDPASECVFFAESTGKFDLKVVDGGKPPASN